MKTIRRRARSHDHQRALAVAAPQRLIQVGLLGFGRQTRRRTSALHVDDHQRQLGHHGQPDRLRFKRQARSGSRRHGEIAGICGSDGRADARYLVLGLKRLDVQILPLGQFLENSRSRRDRIRAAKKRPAAFLGSGHQPPSRRLIAADAAIEPGRQRRRPYHIGIGKRVRVGRIIISALERQHVRLGDGRLFRELAANEIDGMVQRTIVDTKADAQREHILAFGRGLGVQTDRRHGLARHARHVRKDDIIVLQVHLRHRIERPETCPLDAAVVERVAVADDRRPGLQPAGVGPQGGRIHRDQYVAIVARGRDRMIAYMHLKSRDSGNGPLRRAYLGRKVGKGRNAVAHQSCRIGKQLAGHLHSVARVARKTDDDVIAFGNMVFSLHRGKAIVVSRCQK